MVACLATCSKQGYKVLPSCRALQSTFLQTSALKLRHTSRAILRPSVSHARLCCAPLGLSLARTMASTSAVGASSSNRQPPWHKPAQADQQREPSFCIYNSLTRAKNDFVPIHGRNVTWYTCGPTVYDASHLGHARNYVTQDIQRRIMRDYLGYDVHFVMNITDIDDKIIIKARYTHLLDTYRNEHTTAGLSGQLLTDVKEAWSAHFRKTLKKLAPKPPPEEPAEPEDEAAWEEISRRMMQDPAWLQNAIEQQPKTNMWHEALEKSRHGLIAATIANTAGDKSAEAAASLIDSSADILSPWLDAKNGHTLSDPAIFRKTAAYWESDFFQDMKSLHVERPTTLTRVSEYIPEIVTFTQKIIDNGYAYEDAGPGNGKKNVWFDTRAFDGAQRKASSGQDKHSGEQSTQHSYAKLAPWSKGNRELLEEGEGSLSTGSSTTAGKRAPSDFALWKSSKPGEPAWDSPWGPGRPGWHIECSVMASEVLGEQIDIHSGGVDLMFPHHDNELAQSEACHGCDQWINYFMHTGHLHIAGLKMSKSLKNFITIKQALEQFTARQLRLAFLLQLWSARMDFKDSSMTEVRNVESSLNNFFAATKANVRSLRARSETSDGKHHYDDAEKELMEQLQNAQRTFRAAMCDSFDTPTGMAALLDIVSKANIYERTRARSEVNLSVIEAVARYVGDMLRMLGLGEGIVREGDIGWGEASAASDSADGAIDREEVLMPYLQALSSFRDAVRALARKQAPHTELLQLADRLRDQDMVDLGVALEDQEDGSALVKLVDAAQLQAARQEKERAQAEKAAKKAQAAAKAEAARREKLEKGKVAPADMFKPPHPASREFSKWDDQGLPTHDAEGKDLSKSKRKACDKEYEKQTKLHKEYLASLEGSESAV